MASHRKPWLLGTAITLAAIAPREARAEDPPLGDRILVIALTVPVSAAVGGGFLIALKVAGDNATREANAIAAEKPRAPCVAQPDKCNAVDSNLEIVDQSKVGVIVGFSVCGAALAFGIPWIIDGALHHKSTTTSNLEVAPIIAPHAGGVVVGGRF